MIVEDKVTAEMQVSATEPMDDNDLPEVAVKETRANLEAMRIAAQKVEEEKSLPQEVVAIDKGGDTYAKRYADLRRHYEKERRETQKRFEAMEQSIKSLQTENENLKSGNTFDIPRTEEEVKEWIASYPEVASIIRAIAAKEATEKTKELTTAIKETKESQELLKRRQEYAKLVRAHPDFETIKDTKEFRDWLDAQSATVTRSDYWSIMKAGADARAAAEIVSQYKLETKRGPGRPKKESSDISAVASVNINGEQPKPPGGTRREWRESEINKMSGAEYDKYEEEIERAYAENRVIRDVRTGLS